MVAWGDMTDLPNIPCIRRKLTEQERQEWDAREQARFAREKEASTILRRISTFLMVLLVGLFITTFGIGVIVLAASGTVAAWLSHVVIILACVFVAIGLVTSVLSFPILAFAGLTRPDEAPDEVIECFFGACDFLICTPERAGKVHEGFIAAKLNEDWILAIAPNLADALVPNAEFTILLDAETRSEMMARGKGEQLKPRTITYDPLSDEMMGADLEIGWGLGVWLIRGSLDDIPERMHAWRPVPIEDVVALMDVPEATA